jgi:hypothetical protein
MEFANFEALDANALFAAFQQGYTTVEVQFVNDKLNDGNELPSGKMYTYKVPTAWNVQKGDWLVVLPSQAYKPVFVHAVHASPQDYGKDLKWAVMKIDGSFYFQMKTQEEQLKQALNVLKRKRELELLMAELQKTVGGDGINQLMSGFQNLLGVSQAPQNALAAAEPAAQQPAQAPGVATPSINTEAMQAAAAARAPQAAPAQQQPVQAAPQAPANVQPLPQGGIAKPSWAQ